MKKKSKIILSLVVVLAVLIGCVSVDYCMAKDKKNSDKCKNREEDI